MFWIFKAGFGLYFEQFVLHFYINWKDFEFKHEHIVNI